MDIIYELISEIGTWLFLAWAFSVFLTLILIIFLIRVPKELNEISHTLRMMYQYGIRTNKPVPPPPVIDDDREDPNSQYWYKK